MPPEVHRKTGPALTLENVTKRFPGVLALDGIDLEVEHGSVHSLLGENGAGKSTVVNIVAGRFSPDEGDIRIDGRSRRFGSPRESRDSGVSVIHQELALLPDLTVAENILVGQLPKRWGGMVDWSAAREQAQAVANRVGLGADIVARVGNLSTGEQQLVEIARALATEPQILVMDEPTSALSQGEVERLFEVIDELRRRDLAVLFISHRFDEVWHICDQVTVLRDGREVLSRQLEDVTVEEAAEAMIGRSMPTRTQRVSSSTTGVSLRASGVTTDKLTSVDITLHEGEVVGLAGALGSGRTELLRVLAGADAPTSGRITVLDKEVAFSRPADAIARGIYLVPEDRKREGLILPMSAADNISMPALGWVSRFGLVDRRAQGRAAKESIGQLDIKATGPWQRVEKLSGGNQQKIVLARWLALGPRTLLLDEPTRGIDVGAKEEIYRLVRELAKTGVAILFVASEVPELLRVCDRIVVLRSGEVAAEFDAATVTEADIILAAHATSSTNTTDVREQAEEQSR